VNGLSETDGVQVIVEGSVSSRAKLTSIVLHRDLYWECIVYIAHVYVIISSELITTIIIVLLLLLVAIFVLLVGL